MVAMPLVLDSTIMAELERIGRDRSPCEACGLILPFPWRDKQVWELPNRSKAPHDSFEIQGSDIQVMLEDFTIEYPHPEVWDQIVVWHTHPKGNLGPSKMDVENKPKNIASLVLTLFEDAPAKATWF